MLRALKGRYWEWRGLAHLRAQGLRLVCRNYSCRGGEIDLIMRDGEAVVFVEVRYREDSGFGGAAASVTPAKQRRIMLAARHFLAGNPRYSQFPCRYDVLAIQSAGQTIQWIKGAFS